MKKFLPKTVNNSQGFTLVELLVVVAIIAVLSVIGITIFSGVQKNARDAKRRADVDAISKVLETHYNDNGAPCSATAVLPYCGQAHGSFFSGGTVPTNPGPGGADYLINIPAARTSYTVCAMLENYNGNSSDGGNGITFTPNSGMSAGYYCKKNQQ